MPPLQIKKLDLRGIVWFAKADTFNKHRNQNLKADLDIFFNSTYHSAIALRGHVFLRSTFGGKLPNYAPKSPEDFSILWLLFRSKKVEQAHSVALQHPQLDLCCSWSLRSSGRLCLEKPHCSVP